MNKIEKAIEVKYNIDSETKYIFITRDHLRKYNDELNQKTKEEIVKEMILAQIDTEVMRRYLSDRYGYNTSTSIKDE